MLYGAMLEAMAWSDLHDPEIGGRLDTEDLFELAEAAGLSREEVERLASERAWRRMKKELPP